jgi:hypothetical protein
MAIDNTTTDSIDSAVEETNVDQIVDLLKNAAKDATESGDFLSYSTMLDIYLGNPDSFTNEQREELMGCLLEVLASNDKLTYEIGWDIPQLLIHYIDSDYEFNGPIRKAPGVYKILKIFEVLALKGNPKELFLKGCELLTSIRVSDSYYHEDISIQLKFFEIKVYCIFELVDASIKRIHTFYPSKFLSMVVTSFINLIHQNNLESANVIHFVMKRAFTFARNYTSLPLPEKAANESEEDLKKIKSDEDYLQRKLLTGFITQVVHLCVRNHNDGYSISHFSFLHEGNPSMKKFYSYSVDVPVLDRLTELALSFDINLTQSFKDMVKESHTLLDSVDLSQNEVAITGDIFEKLVTDYQKKLAITIVDLEVSSINVSPIGTLILFIHQIAASRTFDQIDISFEDAVALTLRCIVPQMVESSFKCLGIQDVCMFITWYSFFQIQSSKKSAELIISKIPSAFLTIYYQALLHIIMFSGDRNTTRYVSLTLLTKVLALSPELLSYAFIKDTLENCPYDEKAVLIGVFKELLTKERSSTSLKETKTDEAATKQVDSSTQEKNVTKQVTSDVDDLDKKLADVKLDRKAPLKAEAESAPTPALALAPELPERSVHRARKYITLDNDRVDTLLSLVSESINDVFVKENSEVSINPTKFSLISGYLNLLVVIKNEPAVVNKNEALNQKLKQVSENIHKVKEKKQSANMFEVNAAEILNIAIDRIIGN